MKYFSIIVVIFLMISCVPKIEYDKAITEKNYLIKSNDSLEKEIYNLKYGIDNLLSEGKSFFESKEYEKAKIKLDTLISKYPNAPEIIEANKMLSVANEEVCWKNAIESNAISLTDIYIDTYPNGKYWNKAKIRRKDLININEEVDYNEAKKQNQSSTWKEFLTKYPNNKNISAIKESIIRLEVEEIMANIQTGQMPSFQKTTKTNSSKSSIKIKNDTGCELTVRYSGHDAKMIIIDPSDTKTIYLISGEYKVTASACGKDYAGVDELNGNYTSSFYISNTRSNYFSNLSTKIN